MSKEYDVFIIYKHRRNSGQAREVADALRANGLRVWFDVDTLNLKEGVPVKNDALASQLIAAVKSSRVAVVFEAQQEAIVLPPGMTKEDAISSGMVMVDDWGNLIAWNWQKLEIDTAKSVIDVNPDNFSLNRVVAEAIECVNGAIAEEKAAVAEEKYARVKPTEILSKLRTMKSQFPCNVLDAALVRAAELAVEHKSGDRVTRAIRLVEAAINDAVYADYRAELNLRGDISPIKAHIASLRRDITYGINVDEVQLQQLEEQLGKYEAKLAKMRATGTPLISRVISLEAQIQSLEAQSADGGLLKRAFARWNLRKPIKEKTAELTQLQTKLKKENARKVIGPDAIDHVHARWAAN